jgi:hypothetical protein
MEHIVTTREFDWEEKLSKWQMTKKERRLKNYGNRCAQSI